MTVRRFTILLHDNPFVHWDFLVEEEQSAATWRLMRKPCAGEPIFAERLADHRLEYLDYEGPVSNDRGQVKRVLSGEVASETLHQNGKVERELTLAAQSFATSVMIFHSEDGRCFVQFSRD